MTSTGLPQPPTVFASAVRVFDLSLGRMLWSRRSLFLALLTGGPVLLALLIRAASALEFGPGRGPRPTGPFLFGLMMWLLYLRFIIPVLGVFYGTALVADEVEDKTLTYLFIRPIQRSAVLLGKYLAYLVCTSLVVLPSVVIVYFLVIPIRGGSIGATFPSLLADLAVVVLGLVSYGAVFALVGARLKRPLLVGLIFAFGWEPAVLFIPGYLRRLTVAYYVQGLVPHAMPDDSSAGILMRAVTGTPSVPVTLVWLTLLTGAALWFASRALGRREYVLDQ
jgi:ABC-2 type transport system permease protein